MRQANSFKGACRSRWGESVSGKREKGARVAVEQVIIIVREEYFIQRVATPYASECVTVSDTREGKGFSSSFGI